LNRRIASCTGHAQTAEAKYGASGTTGAGSSRAKSNSQPVRSAAMTQTHAPDGSRGDVYVLQHSYEVNGCDETKFIGVYRSRESAEEAMARLREQPVLETAPATFTSTATPLMRTAGPTDSQAAQDVLRAQKRGTTNRPISIRSKLQANSPASGCTSKT